MTGSSSGVWQEPSEREVVAEVKWYNPTKGFGFVQLSDGSPDAFLHASVVERTGRQGLPDGTRIVCDLVEGRKGLQVSHIHRIEKLGSGSSRGGGYGDPQGGDGGTTVEGTVKFFNEVKGYGFIASDGGGKDVFVSARTLSRAGLAMLDSDQRVRMVVRMGERGPMADSVEPI